MSQSNSFLWRIYLHNSISGAAVNSELPPVSEEDMFRDDFVANRQAAVQC